MSKIARRVGIVASLALLPALLFGGAAGAAAVEAQGTSQPPQATQPVENSDQPGRVKFPGVITNVRVGGDVNLGEVLIVTVAPEPGEKGNDVIVTKDTVIEADEGGRLDPGDNVLINALYFPDTHVTIAEHIVVE